MNENIRFHAKISLNNYDKTENKDIRKSIHACMRIYLERSSLSLCNTDMNTHIYAYILKFNETRKRKIAKSLMLLSATSNQSPFVQPRSRYPAPVYNIVNH